MLLVLSSALTLYVLGAAPAHALRIRGSADRMVLYLQNDQNADGGFGGEPKAPSNADFTAWVSIGLAAADVNPKIQRKPGGTDAYTYLLEHAGAMELMTDFERELMVVNAAGGDPHNFAGFNLVKKILEHKLPEPTVGGAAFPHESNSTKAGMNDTIFAVIALSPVHEPEVETAVQEAATWIEHEQNTNGSWPATCPKTGPGCKPFGKEPPGDSDMTGAALEALNAAGHHNTSVQEKGLEYLHTVQIPSEGGFVEQSGETEANVGTTAWVTQGIWAAGQNPETWRPSRINPLTYMERMQQQDGHVKWKQKEELNGVWMTAYAAPAMLGVALPVPEAPPEPPPYEMYEPEPEPGTGGEGVQKGSGVDAGGGGESAPLFSRPQRESKGHAPGGARVLASKASRAKPTKRRRNPGPPRKHPTPILRHEAANSKSVHGEGGAEGQSGKATHLSVPPAPTAKDASDLQQVTGIPIASFHADALEPGSPGLRGAGAKRTSPALAITIAGLVLLLMLSGSAVERNRPQVTP
jgi:hypothetical protein